MKLKKFFEDIRPALFIFSPAIAAVTGGVIGSAVFGGFFVPVICAAVPAFVATTFVASVYSQVATGGKGSSPTKIARDILAAPIKFGKGLAARFNAKAKKVSDELIAKKPKPPEPKL